MVRKPSHSILADQVTYEARAGFPVFKNVSFSLSGEKTALVGKNGSGKTTLLKLVVGELEPTEGKIHTNVRIGYLPQDYQLDPALTLGEALRSESQDHGREDKLQKIFEKLNFLRPELSRELGTLSGGERMKVLLARLLISEPEFLVLDEPTNNLDTASRETIYKLIEEWDKGCLIVSHDRKLLGLMDQTLELSPQGMRAYGGNYDFYKEEKRTMEAARVSELANAKADLKRVSSQAQKTNEKQAKRAVQGKRDRTVVGMSKAALNYFRNKSEHTSAKLKKVHEERSLGAEERVGEAKAALPPEHGVYVDLSRTTVPQGKLVLEVKNISFSFGVEPLIKDLDFSLYGPTHLVVKGPNGAGKSTLLKLILGELSPKEGEVKLGVNKTAYLDQHTSILSQDESLVENVRRTAEVEESEARRWLGRFLFSDEAAFKKASMLSGGERMRAALACILAGEHPPQLLVLDEPTNNLDLDSVERIENALSNYKGALVIISHDEDFLKNVRIDKEIRLES